MQKKVAERYQAVKHTKVDNRPYIVKLRHDGHVLVYERKTYMEGHPYLEAKFDTQRFSSVSWNAKPTKRVLKALEQTGIKLPEPA